MIGRTLYKDKFLDGEMEIYWIGEQIVQVRFQSATANMELVVGYVSIPGSLDVLLNVIKEEYYRCVIRARDERINAGECKLQ